MPINEFGLETGFDISEWQGASFPEKEIHQGSYCTLEPLDSCHAEDLFNANIKDDGRMWTYLPYGPFDNLADYEPWVASMAEQADPQFYAIIDRVTAKAIGLASYLRINPEAGSIEVGHIAFSPELQSTKLATEAMYLMMKKAFDLGYRRYEWKCDALNKRSREAAQRFGFSYEGVFRQATSYKGGNRDTAWFAAIDSEWPALQAAFETWLNPSNFDCSGNQKKRLRDLTKDILVKVDLNG